MVIFQCQVISAGHRKLKIVGSSLIPGALIGTKSPGNVHLAANEAITYLEGLDHHIVISIETI